MDQDLLLIEDILAYLQLRRRIRWELDNPDLAEVEPSKEDDVFAKSPEEKRATGIPTEEF